MLLCGGTAVEIAFDEFVEAFFVAQSFESTVFHFLSDGCNFFFQCGGCVVIFALHCEENAADDNPEHEEGPRLWREETWGAWDEQEQNECYGEDGAGAGNDDLLFVALTPSGHECGSGGVEESEVGTDGGHVNEPGKDLTAKEWRDHCKNHHEHDAKAWHMVFVVELFEA